MPGSVIFFCGQGDAPQLHFAILFDAYLEQLVGKIAVLRKLVRNQREKLPLEAEIQTDGASMHTRPACRRTSEYCPADPGLSAGPRKSMLLFVTKVRSPSRMIRLGCQRRAQVFINQSVFSANP